jgi:hypothetical protein
MPTSRALRRSRSPASKSFIFLISLCRDWFSSLSSLIFSYLSSPSSLAATASLFNSSISTLNARTVKECFSAVMRMRSSWSLRDCRAEAISRRSPDSRSSSSSCLKSSSLLFLNSCSVVSSMSRFFESIRSCFTISYYYKWPTCSLSSLTFCCRDRMAATYDSCLLIFYI